MPQKHNDSSFKESVENAYNLLNKAIELYANENYRNAIDNLSLALLKLCNLVKETS